MSSDDTPGHEPDQSGVPHYRIVDRGRNTTVQIGDDNLHVSVEFPADLQASEIPTVHVCNNESETAEGQVQNTAPSKYELCMLGENGKAQTGSRNRTVSVNTKRKGAGIERSTSQPRTSLPQTVEAVQEQEPTDKSGSDLYEAIPLKTEGSYTTNSTLDLNAQTYRKQTASPEDGTGEEDGELAANVAQHTRESVSWHKYKKQHPQNTSQTNMSDSHHKSKKQDEDTSGHFVTKSSRKIDSSTQTEGYFGVGESGIYFQEVHGPYIQCGPNNSIVNIEVNKDFLSSVKEAGVLTVRDATNPLLSFTWKGNDEKGNEAVKAVKSLWTLQLKELFESMYGQVLLHMSHSLFSPLRELIVDIFKTYDAKLTGIFSGSLLFVFWHADEESAQSMVAGKEVVREMFHQLLLGMGKGEIEFTLDAAVDTSDSMEAAASGKVGGGEEVDADPLASLTVGIDPLTDANIQLKTNEETSKKAADLKEIESRLQSMESSFRRMQREMNEHMDSTRGDMGRGLKEMRDVTQTLIETVLKKTSGTPQDKEPTRSEHTLPTDPFDVSTLMEKRQGFPIAPMTLEQFQQTAYAANMVNAVTADSSLRTKSTDQPTSMTERNEPTEVASNVMVEEAADEQQMSGPGSADIPVSLEGTEIEKDTGILPSRSTKDIPCEPNDGAVPAKQKYGEAEQLLSSLNVADVGGRASDPGVRRWTAAVAAALVHDVPPPPRAMSLDTLLCIDVSDSIGMPGLEEVKQIANKFVDGIEDIAEQHGLEENVGLVSLGGGAKVVQQLTNDYGAVRDAIENLVCCGRSPIFEALLVCVAAMKEGGGVLSVGGAHKIRPRIIFITDGLATDESYPVGQDTASTDLNTKIQLIQLMGELSPKKNSSTPHPITWVPVAAADRSFLSSLSKLGDGNIVEGKDITTLCTYYRVQESIGKIYMCVESREWENLSEAVEVMAGAFIGDMTPEEKRSIIQEVKAKIERKDSSAVDDDPDDFDNLKELKDLPPLGSRVIRGPAWKYQDQDAGGPGTVINHADDEKHVWVEWDLNSVACRYRFGSKGMYDIIEEDNQPRILKPDELIEIGCRVRRGDDWSSGNKDGGPGNIGVIIRKRQDGKVKVRWHNGVIQACNYGYDGKFELAI